MDYSHLSIQENSEDILSCTLTETQHVILTRENHLKTLENDILQDSVLHFSGNKDLLVFITSCGLFTLFLRNLKEKSLKSSKDLEENSESQSKESNLQHLLRGSFTGCSISATHLGAVKNDGVLYVFGNLKHLGIRSSTPVALKTENLFVPRQLVCGRQFTAVSTCGGSVYLYGPSGIRPNKLTSLSAFFISSLAAADDFFVCLSDSGVVHCFDAGGNELPPQCHDLWVVSVACSAKALVFAADSGILACLVFEPAEKKFVKVVFEHVGKVRIFSGAQVIVMVDVVQDENKEDQTVHEEFQFSLGQFFPKPKLKESQEFKWDLKNFERFLKICEKLEKKWENYKKSESLLKLKNFKEYLSHFTFGFNSFIIILTKIGFRLKFETLETLQNHSVSVKVEQSFSSIYLERLAGYFYVIKLEYFHGCMKNLTEDLWILSEVFNRKHLSWAFTTIFNFQPKGKKSFITVDRLLNNVRLKKQKEKVLMKNSMSSPKFQKKNSLFYVKSINNSPKFNSCATERRLEYSMQLSKKLQIKAEKKLSYDFKLNNNIFAYPKAAGILNKVLKTVARRVFLQLFFVKSKNSRVQLINKKSPLISPKKAFPRYSLI